MNAATIIAILESLTAVKGLIGQLVEDGDFTDAEKQQIRAAAEQADQQWDEAVAAARQRMQRQEESE